jgi:xylulose-5-phosphate/fructose-6-phosphate phosphoketolase
VSGGRSIQAIQQHAREQGDATRPRWPMIVLRTPKGWTGPKTVDGVQVEGTWRAHQVPIAEVRTNPEHLRLLEEWMRSYRPGELFGPDGAPIPELAALPPRDYRRMSANPHANGGLLLRELNLPEFRDYAVEVARPGATFTEGTRVLGRWLRDVIAANPTSFRLFGPDETASNRLQARHPGTGTRGRGWSAITWPARRWPPSPVAGRWTPRWGSPRWTAW